MKLFDNMEIDVEELGKILKRIYEKKPREIKAFLILEKTPYNCYYCNNQDEYYYFCPFHDAFCEYEILLTPVSVGEKWMYHYEELINGYTRAQIEEMERKQEEEIKQKQEEVVEKFYSDVDDISDLFLPKERYNETLVKMYKKKDREKNNGERRVRNPRMPQKAKLNAFKERIEIYYEMNI